MGGSGGGSNYADRVPAKELREQTQKELERQELLAEVNALLAEQLIEINDRDVGLVNERLDAIESALGDRLEELERLLFGGSVAKHTYVDGLSDVDTLVLLNGDGLADSDPAQMINDFADAIRAAALPAVVGVSPGNLAVTVTYSDGSQIQLLPAVKDGDELKIAGRTGTTWRAIEPEHFARTLSQVNADNGRAVVPVIKLAKALNGALPEERRLGGYHIEALALDAFKNYSGNLNYAEMVTHLLTFAATNVLKPIPDVTGQSAHVDEYLGVAGSRERQRAAADLGRLSRRLANATTPAEWRDVFDA